jgi:DNA-binding XRE family transcriptional regulator
MIHAYNKIYLGEMMEKLAALFDLAVNYEKIDINEFGEKLANSDIGKEFEQGNVMVVLGKSSNELLAELLNNTPLDVYQEIETSKEYWVGWVLGYCLFELNTSFNEIFSFISCNELRDLYYPYHEADVNKIKDLIKMRFGKDTKLKQMRKKRNLSQSELSYLSGISLRSIRAYEQRVNDVSKAEGITLYNLSNALNCKIEDILE